MKSETRDLIVNTAAELFYSKGYNLVGINEIIEKSGIAKATLYSHFKSKEDLCIAYLDKKDTELLQSIETYCNNKPKGKKRLIAILEFVLDFYNTGEFNGCWCIRTKAEIPASNDKIQSKIKDNKAKLLDLIYQLVTENAPLINKSKSTKLSKTLYLLYEGSVTECHLQDDSWPASHSIELAKSILKEI